MASEPRKDSAPGRHWRHLQPEPAGGVLRGKVQVGSLRRAVTAPHDAGFVFGESSTLSERDVRQLARLGRADRL